MKKMKKDIISIQNVLTVPHEKAAQHLLKCLLNSAASLLLTL
jgi:hypothetical protein